MSGPTTFSAKFHQQTCTSSRRLKACQNLESIIQPAGEGGGGTEEEKVVGRGLKQKERRSKK